MNMQQIISDPDLWNELVKAYQLSAPYREQVQFRLAIINMNHTHIWDDIIWNIAMFPSSTIIDAISGFKINLNFVIPEV